MLPRLKNEVGNQHGRLTVLGRAGLTKRGAATWLCKCACGQEVVVVGTRLRSGSTQSCGCFRSERIRETNKLVPRHILPTGEAAFNELFHRMRYSAKRRGHIWDLSNPQVKRITAQACYYCGVEPAQQRSRKDLNGAYMYNGLDRVDNEKGYTLENVVPCCGNCNFAKRTMRQDEFLAWISQVYTHSISKG